MNSGGTQNGAGCRCSGGGRERIDGRERSVRPAVLFKQPTDDITSSMSALTFYSGGGGSDVGKTNPNLTEDIWKHHNESSSHLAS